MTILRIKGMKANRSESKLKIISREATMGGRTSANFHKKNILYSPATISMQSLNPKYIAKVFAVFLRLWGRICLRWEAVEKEEVCGVVCLSAFKKKQDSLDFHLIKVYFNYSVFFLPPHAPLVFGDSAAIIAVLC